MTLFEYITIASSIILSFAVVRLLDTIPHAFNPARRSWVHSSLVVVALWGCAQFWWISWSLSGNVHWTYPKFLLYLAASALIYSMAKTLSSPDPSQVDSFSDYFHRVHKRFFGILAAYLVVLILISWLLYGLPLVHPVRPFQLAALVLASSGIFVANAKYHGTLAGLLLLQLLIGTVGAFMEPGGGLQASP